MDAVAVQLAVSTQATRPTPQHQGNCQSASCLTLPCSSSHSRAGWGWQQGKHTPAPPSGLAWRRHKGPHWPSCHHDVPVLATQGGCLQEGPCDQHTADWAGPQGACCKLRLPVAHLLYTRNTHTHSCCQRGMCSTPTAQLARARSNTAAHYQTPCSCQNS